MCPNGCSVKAESPTTATRSQTTATATTEGRQTRRKVVGRFWMQQQQEEDNHHKERTTAASTRRRWWMGQKHQRSSSTLSGYDKQQEKQQQQDEDETSHHDDHDDEEETPLRPVNSTVILRTTSTPADDENDLEGGITTSTTTPTTTTTTTTARVQVFHHHRQQNVAVVLAWLQQKRAMIGVFLLVSLVFYHSQPYWSAVLNKETIQTNTMAFLERLRPDHPSQEWKALCIYAMAMTAWEFVGLSTIPVETASAMVFGWPAALYSFAGKLLGAVSAFTVGRTLWADWARTKLAKNDIFQLLIQTEIDSTTTTTTEPLLHATATTTTTSSLSVPMALPTHNKKKTTLQRHPPLLTAFLMKYSVFPEPIKNFGSSILSIQLWHFILATAVHGGKFTLLWTWLGVDAARRLQAQEGAVIPPNRGLETALSLFMVFTFVLTPLLMAWWVRDLRRIMKVTAAAAAAAATNTSTATTTTQPHSTTTSH